MAALEDVTSVVTDESSPVRVAPVVTLNIGPPERGLVIGVSDAVRLAVYVTVSVTVVV